MDFVGCYMVKPLKVKVFNFQSQRPQGLCQVKYPAASLPAILDYNFKQDLSKGRKICLTKLISLKYKKP